MKDNNGTPQTSPKSKVSLLLDQFNSVFSTPTDTKIEMKTPPAPTMDPFNISTEGVTKLMRNLSPFKSTGPDGIPPFILKELSNELAPVFTLLFQASLSQGKIPLDWKMAHITPIFKKGDPSKASNYRPVSLTSIPCKLFEHIIHSQIMNHLTRNKILCDNQHGFRKLRSCESQLISLVNDLSKSVDEKGQTDLILLDFAKAFDKVNHASLLQKLSHYGIRNNLHRLIHDFLTERKQLVSMDGAMSDPAPVLSGVPQGTVLGPLLFLIYINDLPEYVSEGTSVRLFADDSAMYRKIQSQRDHEILQKDIKALEKWESIWSMKFHPDKCQLLKVTTRTKRKTSTFNYNIHNTTIQDTENANYLGVNINNKLSWNKHIDNTCRKGNRTINFIHRNFKDCNQKVKEKLYKTYVRPSMEYCSSVWDPYTQSNIDKLEQVQRRAARLVTNNFSRYTRVTPLLHQLQWTPLAERRARTKVTILYKALNNLIEIPTNHLTVNTGGTRQANNFDKLFAYKDQYKHSFYPSTCDLWNKIPIETRNAQTLPIFQAGLPPFRC